MLWGMDRPEWFMLWSGFLGAIPAALISAVVAALVAIFVLEKSNAHQRELSREAIENQRVFTESQLEEQRRDAFLRRERDSIASLIIAAQEFGEATHVSMLAIQSQHSVLRSALIRWQIDLGRGGLGDELHSWSAAMLRAGMTVWIDEDEAPVGVVPRSRRLLNEAIAVLCTAGSEWQRASPEMHRLLISGLSKTRRGLEDFLNDPSLMRD